MGYICTKRLNLSGKEYYPGDSIPDDAFLGDRARKLKSFGYIAESDSGNAFTPGAVAVMQNLNEEPTVCVVFSEGDESAAYPVNAEQLQAIADTMQKTANDAVAAIEGLTDESVLAFLFKVDSRKAVREAAQKRLASLYSGIAKSSQSSPVGAQEDTEGSTGQADETTAQ